MSRGLARPAEQLYCEVLAANGKQTFPKFSHTGIRELDRFAEAITQLNSSLVTNSTKFCASWTWPVWSWAATSCGMTPAVCM